MSHWHETSLWRQKIETTQFKVVDIATSLEAGHEMLKADRAGVICLGIELPKASSWISREAV